METEHLDRLVRRTLGADYRALEVVHYLMTEYVQPEARCRVAITLRSTGAGLTERQEVFEGQGTGFVEAAFRGLVEHFGREHRSLALLGFVGFDVVGRMETSSDSRGLDALARVRVTVNAPNNQRIEFVAQARSTLAASLRAVVRVVEHFTNAERATRRLQAEVEASVRDAAGGILLATLRAELATLRPLTGLAA